MDVNRELGSRLVKSGGYLVHLQAKALLLPWTLCRIWMLGSVNILLALFHLLGVLPNEFANRGKIAELNRHIDIMHQREDEFRRRIEILTEQLEAQSRDKSKAIKKLQRSRAEAQELSFSLEGMQASQLRHGRGDSSRARPKLTHTLLWGAILAVYSCSGTMSAIELKLALSVIVPVALMYFMVQTSSGGRHSGWDTVVIQCVSSGVIGFTLDHVVC